VLKATLTADIGLMKPDEFGAGLEKAIREGLVNDDGKIIKSML
jgi:hypothetical protein